MNRSENLYQFFSKQFPFNREGLYQLINSFEVEVFEKEAMLLKPNTIDLKLRFIESGFVREFYTTNDKEVNVNFYEANQFSTDLISFFENKTSLKNQQCLTDVKVLTLSRQLLEEILKKYNCGHEIIKASFQKALASKESFERKKITKSTEERYKELQLSKPNWLKHIPQYHIASYLNVTPETLSRIRKRIY